MLAELKESLPKFFRESKAFVELEQQAVERDESRRAEALEQLADCDVRHSSVIPPLETAIEAGAATVKAAEQSLEDARRKLSQAMQARQAAYYPIDRDRQRLTFLLEGELADPRITAGMLRIEAECDRLRGFSGTTGDPKEAAAKQRAVTARLQHLLNVTRPALLALRTQRVKDVDEAIRKHFADAPEA